MNLSQSVILSCVEALTEFLPVSSTGHMILTSHFLGIEESLSTKVFEIAIQSAAVFAIVLYYRTYLTDLMLRIIRRDAQGLKLLKNLLIAFMPSAVIGLMIHHWIEAHLFGFGPVTGALIVGGIIMILVERKIGLKATKTLDNMTSKDALVVGTCQVFSMWPGVSRSMSTILGARVSGFSTVESAQFSFLLAIPTLVGATVLAIAKEGRVLFTIPDAALVLGTGALVTFAVSLVVIHTFLGYLRKHSMEVFGWYRIIFGLILLGFLR